MTRSFRDSILALVLACTLSIASSQALQPYTPATAIDIDIESTCADALNADPDGLIDVLETPGADSDLPEEFDADAEQSFEGLPVGSNGTVGAVSIGNTHAMLTTRLENDPTDTYVMTQTFAVPIGKNLLCPRSRLSISRKQMSNSPIPLPNHSPWVRSRISAKSTKLPDERLVEQ